MTEDTKIRIHIVFSAKHIPKDIKREFFSQNGDVPVPMNAMYGVLYTVDGSVKKAFICASRIHEVECQHEECYAQTLCPPENLEPWEVPMAAERILMELQSVVNMVEVPAWSIQTFGMKE